MFLYSKLNHYIDDIVALRTTAHEEGTPTISPTKEQVEQTLQEVVSSEPATMADNRTFRKYSSLLVLIFQNTALVLAMRYSRTSKVGDHPYLPTTAVVLAELLKLCVCVVMVFHTAKWNLSKGLNTLHTEIIQKKTETLKVSIPSVLYTIQNNLLYLALTYLDAATFQVCSCYFPPYCVFCVLFILLLKIDLAKACFFMGHGIVLVRVLINH